MQVETQDQVCPLCRRAGGPRPHASGPSRLCYDCCLMIEPMAPRSYSRQSYSGFAPGIQASLAGASAITTEVMTATTAIDPVFISPRQEDKDLSSFMTLEESVAEPAATKSEHPDLELALEATAADTADSVPPSQELEHASEREPAEASWLTAEDVAAETTESRAAAREWRDQRFEFAREEDVTDVAEPARATAFLDNIAADEAITEPPRSIEAETSGAKPEGFVAATDPWENPLPAWEYSQNEWPVMLGPKEKRQNKKAFLLIAAVVLLAVLAGLFFFVIKPGAGSTELGNEAQLAQVASAPSTAQPGGQVPPAAATTAAQSTPRPESTAPTQSAPAAGRYSLQASASPSKAEADEFAAKLRQAGLPAYVVSADLGRKGVWYRVRVGGFESAQDALQFAAEAKERARASGLALKNLNVVENDKL